MFFVAGVYHEKAIKYWIMFGKLTRLNIELCFGKLIIDDFHRGWFLVLTFTVLEFKKK